MDVSSTASVATACVALLICGPLSAQVTQRVNIAWDGQQADGNCSHPPISADGRYVAFDTQADNLVPGDTNGLLDVFLRDRLAGTTERVSVGTGGAQANGSSLQPSISADGRFVVFWSHATNLVDGDTNGFADVFVRDRQTGTTERVSIATGGAQGDDFSGNGVQTISADGRYVVFESRATNLVDQDTNGWSDIFVRDRQNGKTDRANVGSGEEQANGQSIDGSISADGRFVAFASSATNLVPGGTSGGQVFVRDREAGTTELASIAEDGSQGDDSSFRCVISADGLQVAFTSEATNLVPMDTNGWRDIFVRDRESGTTERASVASGGTQVSGLSDWPSISADGRYVAFESDAPDVAGGDTNFRWDIFIHDRQSGATDLLTVSSSGVQGDAHGGQAAVSGDGRYVAFQSNSTNLVPGDTNAAFDVFVRDRLDGTAFTSLCDPGLGGVIACPCSNPPSSPGRGCDNSSSTGGAVLAASGGAYLSSDSLVFTTSGQRPTAISILLQGNGSIAGGVVYGQGVRCAGGTLRRLFTKTASGGSITAPEFSLGDPTVSTRSAERGDVILAGQSRWYLVYYRDPDVLGGCPASSTFNATQTGEVSWTP